MGIINKIYRITELPELSDIKNSKVVIAYNRKNYIIDSSLIAGKKIVGISESKTTESGKANVISIRFSDGSISNLYVYNGSAGDRGEQGEPGVQGDTGEAGSLTIAEINQLTRGNYSEGDELPIQKIVNDYVSSASSEDTEHDSSCKDAWSAYRGKYANEQISKLNETFVSDYEYDLLWNEESIKWLYAEFTTSEEEQETSLFNSDTNSHIVYKKYWTYEEGEMATYYVAIYEYDYQRNSNGDIMYGEDGKPIINTDADGNLLYVLDSEGNPVIERYDTVTASLWDDIYLGAKYGYFPATTEQLANLETIYVYDSNLGKYVEVNVDRRLEVDGEENSAYKDKDFNYYSENLKEYLHVHYENLSNQWLFELIIENENKFEKPLWKEDYNKPIVITTESGDTILDGYELTEVTENEEIDYTGSTKYFWGNDKEKAIEDIESYLSFSDKQCFVKEYNADKTSYKLVEKEYETLEDDDARAEFIESLKNNEEEFFVVTSNRLDGIYTFEYSYPTIVKNAVVYETVSETYDGKSITFYTYFDKRTYFTSELVITTNEETGEQSYETIYHEIAIPVWIYAEFTTNEEDQTSLILNSVTEDEETNEEIDITAEDAESDAVIVKPKFFAFVEMDPIYEKITEQRYDEVQVSDLDLSPETHPNPYYSLDPHYDPISYEEAVEIFGTENVYVYNEDNDTYDVFSGKTLRASTQYYRYNLGAKAIADVNGLNSLEEHISEQHVTISAGIPIQLHFVFVPDNTTYKCVNIEYDSDIVTLYEDGRICAIAPDPSKSTVETDMRLTLFDPDTEQPCGNTILFHFSVLVPMHSIIVSKDGIPLGNANTPQKRIKINIQKTKENEESDVELPNETIELMCTPTPSNTSNMRLNCVSTNPEVLKVEDITDPEVDGTNVTKVKLTGLSKGNAEVVFEAIDGYGAKATCYIEVVKPVESVSIVNTDYEGTTIVSEKDGIHYMTLLKDVPYHYHPKFEPEDASYPELIWTAKYSSGETIPTTNTSFINVVSGTVEEIVVPAEIRKAEQQDIDDNVHIDEDGHIVKEGGKLVEIGDDIIVKEAETKTVPDYEITVAKVTDLEGHALKDDGTVDLDNEGNPKTILLSAELKDIYGMQTDRHKITFGLIVNQSVAEILVNPSNLTFNVGNVSILSATVNPPTAQQGFVWEVEQPSDSTVVEIEPIPRTNTVKVTTKNPGTADIIARATDGSRRYGKSTIVVTVPILDINLQQRIVYVGIGKTQTIDVVNIEYAGFVNVDERYKLGVEWTIANSSIASVQPDGNSCTVTGNSLGSTTLVAKAKDNSGALGAIQVVTIQMIDSLSFENAENISMDVNDTLSLVPVFNPANSTNQALTWSSSDESIATVNNSGIVTAVSSGSVTITARTTDGGNAEPASCTITIN